MLPEYALAGLFSIKTDVFSFGVLVLEILSGRKNTSFYHEGCLNLLEYISSYMVFAFVDYYSVSQAKYMAWHLIFRHGSYGQIIHHLN